MTNKIKLLYITNGINGSGGLERVLSIKASYLADKMNYQVHIMVLNNSHQNLFYTFSERIKYHSIQVKGNPFSYIIQYRKGIKSTLDLIKPDVISVCDDGLKGMLFPILFGKKTPVVYERHVSKNIEQKADQIGFISRLRLNLKHSLMNFSGSRFNKFIVLTNGNTKEWKLNNLAVIPNPLPFYPNRNSSLTSKKVLVVGKQSYQKGYERLLQIWKPIHDKFPDWTLEIYGKLAPNLGLEKQAIRLGIEKEVLFFPPTKKITEKYSNASIYAMTSRFEGFGMVLIEAMAYGVPCVAFDCPHGPADIIADGVDGFLVKNGDMEAFAKALIQLIKNEEKRRQMGALAKENVKRYLPENVMPLWDELFRELV